MFQIFNIFQQSPPARKDPNEIIEVHVNDYTCYTEVCKHDCLVLYKTSENEAIKLEIVVQIDVSRTCDKSFSIHRTNDERSGQLLYDLYKEKLPLLVQCVRDIRMSKSALQNVSQLIREKPSWTVAHIAAHLGYTDCFKNTTVQSQKNIQCEDALMTPLHTAVKAQQRESVMYLMDLNARLDIADINGETVFHYAATANKDIIQILTRKPVDSVINLFNNAGCTPLHIACMANKTDCVVEFLKVGANVNDDCSLLRPKDSSVTSTDSALRPENDILETYSKRFFNNSIKSGGNPLHWTETTELTEALIEHGYDVNARNFDGDTPLHIMVRRNLLSCAIVLLSQRAEVDIQNNEGNTPLHLAVRCGDLSLVQTFISFGADINILNNKGESPRHIAGTEQKNSSGSILNALHVLGAKRCMVPMYSCNDGCSINGQFNGIWPKNCSFAEKTETLFDEALLSTTGKSYFQAHKSYLNCSTNSFNDQSCRVLCLDGGGIKGLVLIQMLDELEKILGKPVVQFFDVVAGTSTGGILALALATGKSIQDCRCLYFRLKDKVFVGGRPYNADLLETFLKKELGETTVMSDIKRPRLMITAARGDRKPAQLHIFRNYKSPLELLNRTERDILTNEVLPNPQEQLIWQAARATGAAPTYFRASGPYIDGGLIANNPTLDALTEIHQCNQALIAVNQSDKLSKVKVVVSLGTGRPPLVPINTIDICCPDDFSSVCRVALGVTDLGEVLIDQATQADGRVTARALALCSMLNIPYIRLNPQLTEKVALDETNNKTLVKILWETTAYMRMMKDELEELKKLLNP